jgi:hypothetical protein
MEIERQHIIVKRGSKIICMNEQGQNIVAELQRDICCWPEGIDTFDVKQLEVLEEGDDKP